MTTATVLAVVAGHGQFADGVVSALDQITGRGAAFTALSNTGLTPSDIEVAIATALGASKMQVVFTDLPAGSCTMAVRRLQRSHPELLLVTSSNVAVLMEFLFAVEGPLGHAVRGLDDIKAVVNAAAEKARGTLAVQGGNA